MVSRKDIEAEAAFVQGLIDQARAEARERITFWVIYHSPSDYPGKYVVRAQWAERGGVIKYSKECTVHDTLDQARAAVPPGCWPFARDANDDPVIVESWMQ